MNSIELLSRITKLISEFPVNDLVLPIRVNGKKVKWITYGLPVADGEQYINLMFFDE